MLRLHMRSGVYGSVFVCLCRLLQLLKGKYRLLVTFSWIAILCSPVIVVARFSYLNAIAAFSIVHSKSGL